MAARFPPLERIEIQQSFVDNDLMEIIDEEAHADAVCAFMIERDLTGESINNRDDWRRRVQKERHHLGVTKPYTYEKDDLVMLYNGKSAKQKMKPSYRGPFVVVGPGGEYKVSYTLRQIDGSPIKRHFYGDHLQPFELRTGHLKNKVEVKLPQYQNIRARTGKQKLPKGAKKGEGIWSTDDTL